MWIVSAPRQARIRPAIGPAHAVVSSTIRNPDSGSPGDGTGHVCAAGDRLVISSTRALLSRFLLSRARRGRGPPWRATHAELRSQHIALAVDRWHRLPVLAGLQMRRIWPKPRRLKTTSADDAK